MIDWLTLVAPLPHSDLIFGGMVASIEPDGSVEWQVMKRRRVAGSFSTPLQVRTAVHKGDRTHIEIHGNPVKFIQGHNLWGPSDVGSIAIATVELVADLLGIDVPPAIRAQWHAGEIQLTRVDCTESFHLANQAEVLAFIRSAEQTAHISRRGRGELSGGSTLVFGKHSRRRKLTLYAKGPEIRAKGHGQEAILDLPEAVEWANRTLRAELRLFSMELKRLGLSRVKDWLPIDETPLGASALLVDQLGKMTMTTTASLPPEVLEKLPSRVQLAYSAWAAGVDMRNTLSKATFYRYRAQLLEHGIDMATLMPKEVSNVVPLYRVLEAKPVGVPDWAIGTPLYWEPPQAA